MQGFERTFFDPVLRGPLVACALMGSLGAVIGCIVVFRRQSLLGEALAHACYPGMVVGAILSKIVFDITSPTAETVILFLSATVTAFLSAKAISWLVAQRYASSDSALSCLLATTFATGLLLVSAVQSIQPSLWRRLEGLLMGQAATMHDTDVLISFVLSALVFGIVVLFHRSLKTALFDADFARLGQLMSRGLEWLFLGVLVITIIIGIRAMGIVLLSSMLIFPAVSGRLLSSHFEKVFVIAAIIGGLCGFGGALLSHQVALGRYAGEGRSLWIPTGPLIALLLAGCFGAVLLFSPSNGLVMRAWRRYGFVRRCHAENCLKLLWKACSHLDCWTVTVDQLSKILQLGLQATRGVVRRLQRDGFVQLLPDGRIEMTRKGSQTGKKLVRLHRLWELYLVEYCGMPKERVHPSAEEMEHILTPEVEQELSVLLHNPAFCPHKQPIPSAELEGSSHG